MTHLVLNGLIGLMLGVALHLCRVDRADNLLATLILRRRGEAKALLWAAGVSGALTALLMWLAVIDVDEIPLLPLTGRVLAGGAIAGVSLGLTGFTPETAFAGVGGGRFTESLCAVIGCVAAYLLFPWAEKLFALAEGWFQPVRATLFRVTLQEASLLPGSFLSQGCIGLVLCLAAICIRRWKPAPAPAALPPAEIPEPPSLEPDTVQEETVVIALPGEETVVIDTEEVPEEAAEAESPQDPPAEDDPEP